MNTPQTYVDMNNWYKERTKNQPCYIVADDSYDRMLTKLRAGEPFVKTYSGVCPHKRSGSCTCPFFKNTLSECGNHIERDGKPVYSITQIRQFATN
jgi:hypothetical protein